MEYEYTEERRAYLEARGLSILAACPGSGKTTSIVKKLRDVSAFCKTQYGQHTGFACLSFTNKACDELIDKYRDMHDERLSFPNVVSTIDSFIMQTIVLPFWYLCDFCTKKPIVMNEDELINRVYFSNVWKDGTWKSYLDNELSTFRTIFYKKDPSKVTRELNGYNWNHNPVTVQSEIDYCEKVFKYRLEKGYINSSDALWIACNILENHPEITHAIVKRFPYIIVDEAQDNSAQHFLFFKLLREAGLENMEYVGDICQSIYGFRDARPELLRELMENGEWHVLHFSECRRSNQRIIDLYSKLKPADLPDIHAHNVEDAAVPIIVYKYDQGNVRDVIRDFHQVCSDNGLQTSKVLARGKDACKRLAGVKDVKFKYWKSKIPYLLIDAVFNLYEGEMNDAFRKIRFVLAEYLGGDSPEQRKEYIHRIDNDVVMNARIFKFLRQIPSFELSFSEWTDKTTALMQTFWGLEERPLFEAFKRKHGYVMRDMAQMPVVQFHSTNDSASNYHKSVDTIHAVKGATLDAILLFLSQNSTGQSISLNDFISRDNNTMTERQRMVYVACSRARQFLAIAVPGSVSDDVIERALHGIKFEIRTINLQGELFFDEDESED